MTAPAIRKITVEAEGGRRGFVHAETEARAGWALQYHRYMDEDDRAREPHLRRALEARPLHVVAYPHIPSPEDASLGLGPHDLVALFLKTVGSGALFACSVYSPKMKALTLEVDGFVYEDFTTELWPEGVPAEPAEPALALALLTWAARNFGVTLAGSDIDLELYPVGSAP